MPVQQWLLQIINEQLVARGDRCKHLQRHRVLINAHTRRSPMLDEPMARVHNAGFETAFNSIVKSIPGASDIITRYPASQVSMLPVPRAACAIVAK